MYTPFCLYFIALLSSYAPPPFIWTFLGLSLTIICLTNSRGACLFDPEVAFH